MDPTARRSAPHVLLVEDDDRLATMISDGLRTLRTVFERFFSTSLRGGLGQPLLPRLHDTGPGISGTQYLAELSERIGSLRHLRMFDLRADGNRLTSLPEWIGELRALRELHLRNNRLTTLPASIGKLQDLRQLDLRSHPLRKVPPAIAALPELDKLDLRWVTTLAPPAWFDGLEARGCLIYR